MNVRAQVCAAVLTCLWAAGFGGSGSATPISYRDSVRPRIYEGERLHFDRLPVYPLDPLIACAKAGLPAARALRTCMPEWGGDREPWRIGWLLRAMDRRGSPWVHNDQRRQPGTEPPELPITPDEPLPLDTVEATDPGTVPSGTFDSDGSELSPAVVPEPGTVALVLTGLISLGRIMRKRHSEVASGRYHTP